MVLTSLTRDEMGREADAAAVLTKPVSQARLYECLTAVASSRPGAPLAPALEEPAEAGPSPVLAPEGVHILVIEDDPVNQLVATRMLESIGCIFDLANDGREAVEAASLASYAAILMDVQMPEMDGHEATAEIRGREGAARHTPIIAMTANAMPGDRERALASGMDDYLAKPVKRADLEAVLARWALQTRRDVLIELGGFSRDFTCEDIEMTFRVHEAMRREGRPYRILSLPEAVSFTEAPHNWKNLYRQRHRWQRVICETFWAYRRMFLNPRYGAVGMVGMPYYLLGEVLPWVPEVAALVIIPLALFLGVFAWWPLVVFLGIFVLTNVLISVMGILLQDVGFRTLSPREIRRLILLSFVESFGYRQLLSWARLAGTVAFFRGEKGWQKFSRVERGSPPPSTRTPFGPDTEKTT